MAPMFPAPTWLWILIVVVLAACFATIIGIGVRRRRVDSLLRASGFFAMLGVLCCVVPLCAFVWGANPIATGVLSLTLLPAFPVLVLLGVSCFAYWSGRKLLSHYRRGDRPN
jgi:hypothetical protein